MKEVKTTSQIASVYKVHPIQVGVWRKELVKSAHTIFDNTKKGTTILEEKEKQIEKLYTIIGEREADISWLNTSALARAITLALCIPLL